MARGMSTRVCEKDCMCGSACIYGPSECAKQLSLIASATNWGDFWLKPSMPLAVGVIKTHLVLFALADTNRVTDTATVAVAVTVTATVTDTVAVAITATATKDDNRYSFIVFELWVKGALFIIMAFHAGLPRPSPFVACSTRHSVSRIAFISTLSILSRPIVTLSLQMKEQRRPHPHPRLVASVAAGGFCITVRAASLTANMLAMPLLPQHKSSKSTASIE